MRSPAPAFTLLLIFIVVTRARSHSGLSDWINDAAAASRKSTLHFHDAFSLFEMQTPLSLDSTVRIHASTRAGSNQGLNFHIDASFH